MTARRARTSASVLQQQSIKDSHSYNSPSRSSKASRSALSNPVRVSSNETSRERAAAATPGGKSGRGFSSEKGNGGGEGLREDGVGENMTR